MSGSRRAGGATSGDAHANRSLRDQAIAVAVCHRCGAFVCEACAQQVDAHRYCSTCAARPDVDYIEAYRLAHFGRRDGWAWFFGLGGVLSAMAGLSFALTALKAPADRENVLGHVRLSIFLLASGVVGVAWFLGRRWARRGLGVLFVQQAVLVLISAGVALAPALLLQAAMVYSALNSPRSRLFFKLDVPHERLKRDWAIYHDNRAARTAMVLGVSGLADPGSAWWQSPLGPTPCTGSTPARTRRLEVDARRWQPS